MYIYIYVYVCIYKYTYMCVYISMHIYTTHDNFDEDSLKRAVEAER